MNRGNFAFVRLLVISLLAGCGGGGSPERRDSLEFGTNRVTVSASASVNQMPQVGGSPGCPTLFVGAAFKADPPPVPALTIAALTLEDAAGKAIWTSEVTVAAEQPNLATGVLSAFARGCAPTTGLSDGEAVTAVFEVKSEAGTSLLVAPPTRLLFLY